MVTAGIEEYLEAIYRLIEKGEKVTTTNISKLLKVAPPSVTGMLQRLDAEGYIQYEPYKDISLTKKGRDLGKRIVKRHRIVEKFLEMIGLQRHRIHDEACRLEHAVSDYVEKAIDKTIGYPERSPTGMQIPRDEKIKPVIDLKSGEKGVVVEIKGGKGIIQRLLDMGLTPGNEIRVTKSLPSGPIEVLVRGSRLAISRGIAMKILVEVK